MTNLDQGWPRPILPSSLYPPLLALSPSQPSYIYSQGPLILSIKSFRQPLSSFSLIYSKALQLLAHHRPPLAHQYTIAQIQKKSVFCHFLPFAQFYMYYPRFQKKLAIIFCFSLFFSLLISKTYLKLYIQQLKYGFYLLKVRFLHF